MTNYISDITLNNQTYHIGGNNFNGAWQWRGGEVVASIPTIALQKQQTIDLSSLIPEDGYDYEVLFDVRVWTPSSSKEGAQTNIYLFPSNTSGIYSVVAVSPSTSATCDRRTLFMVIKSGKRTLGVKNAGNQAGQNLTILFRAIRRVCTYTYNSPISNIEVNNENIPIGGKNFDGKWVSKNSVLASSSTLASNTSKNFDLSSYLPNDGNNYEVVFNVTLDFPNTSNTKDLVALLSAQVPANSYQTAGSILYVIGRKARGAVTEPLTGSVILPIFANNKKITLKNDSPNAGISDMWFAAEGYRRLGTNI